MPWANPHQTEEERRRIIERLLKGPEYRDNPRLREILEGVRDNDVDGLIHVFPDGTMRMAGDVTGPDDWLKRGSP